MNLHNIVYNYLNRVVPIDLSDFITLRGLVHAFYSQYSNFKVDDIVKAIQQSPFWNENNNIQFHSILIHNDDVLVDVYQKI